VEPDDQWHSDERDEPWSMAGRRFPGTSLGLTAPGLDAVLSLRAEITRTRRLRRNLGLGLFVPGSLVGLSIGLYAGVECRVDCSDEDEDALRRAGRMGAVTTLTTLGVAWLLIRAGNAIRDLRGEIRGIRRHGLRLSSAWPDGSRVMPAF